MIKKPGARLMLALALLLGACDGSAPGDTPPDEGIAAEADALETRRGKRIADMASGPATARAPDHRARFNALAPEEGLGVGESDIVFNPNDTYWGLPRTPGVEEVSAYCGGCHSLQMVMSQHATQARWSYLLDWMVAEQGMAPIPPEDRDTVLDYLTRHFGANTSRAREE